jgi:hypothetical protein
VSLFGWRLHVKSCTSVLRQRAEICTGTNSRGTVCTGTVVNHRATHS